MTPDSPPPRCSHGSLPDYCTLCTGVTQPVPPAKKRSFALSVVLGYLVALGACTRTPPVQRISIIDMPKVEISNLKTSCYLPEKPDELEEPAWPDAGEDYYRRQYVHRRDYGLAIQHIRDQDIVIDAMRDCITALMAAGQ